METGRINNETSVLGYWVKQPGVRAVFVPYTPKPQEITELDRANIAAVLLSTLAATEERFNLQTAKSGKRGKVPPASLVRAVASYEAHVSGVTAEQILSNRRPRKFAWPRQRLYVRLRGYGYGYIGIGKALGVDHTTVLYGVHRVKARAQQQAYQAGAM